MNMNEFNELLPIKFMIVLEKMRASLMNPVEQHIKTMDLNTTEFLILYTIATHGNMTIQAIANKVSVTSGNMTYTIDKLEKRQWIERIRCPEDRRKIYIALTMEGRKKWVIVMDKHHQYMHEAFQAIDSDLLAMTLENMKTIGMNFNNPKE